MKKLEHYKKPLASKKVFLQRIIRYFAFSMAVLILSLAVGVVGYHFIGGLGWIDAFLNASMILTGMGPVNPMQTDGGKIFASFYALFSGIAFLSIVSIIMAPFIHRFLHKFHLAPDSEDEKED